MEYISKEDVLGKLYLDHKDVTYIDKNAAAERIKKIQSIDIVRCKECRWFKPWNVIGTRKDGYCEFARMTHDGLEYINTNPDDFCSYGERKTNAD